MLRKNGWPVVRLGDIARTTSGGTPRRDRPQFYGGNIPWVKSGELGDSVVYETGETITEEAIKSSNAKVFPKGTLCIALYGATVGKLGILGIDAATNQAVCAIFPPDELDTRYLYRFFESKRRELVEQGKGGAQPNISQGIIRDTKLPLPPLGEQREIVAEIEKQFTRLGAGVSALRRVQANLKRYRAAVLKAACEGKLVPTDLTSWQRVRVSEIGEVVTGNTPPTSDKENLGEQLPFFKPTDLDAGYHVREARQYLSAKGAKHARVLPASAVLVTCIGATIGKTGFARVDCATNQQINALVVNPKVAIPEWAFCLFSSPEGQQQIKGRASATTLPILNKSKFGALEFALPPLLQQTQIIAEVERRMSVIEKLGSLVSVNLQRTARLRQAILQSAFEGRFS